jgi:hypothetical protein
MEASPLNYETSVTSRHDSIARMGSFVRFAIAASLGLSDVIPEGFGGRVRSEAIPLRP